MRGVKIMIGNEFFTGINYWGSEYATNMWSNFNEKSIENDMKLLKGAGITHLRIFPLWPVFQPLHALYSSGGVYEYTFGEEPLPDTDAGRAGVSEEACRNFETFCNIAEKYDMKLMVGLITGQMSFRIYAPPAFEGKDLLSDPTVIKWQLKFVRYFVERFKNQKAIIGWDLGNETACMPGLNGKNPDTFYVWCSAIAYAIKSCDQDRPVVSGLDHAYVENAHLTFKDIADMCDVHTSHLYNIFSTNTVPLNTMKSTLDLIFHCRIGEDLSGIPNFLQEFGSIGYMNCSKKAEVSYYRASLWATLAHNCHGVMWWCAFDQGHHEFAPYRWNNIGSDYGFFTKNLEEKPIVEENRKFKKILSLLPGGNLPEHRTDATILIQKDCNMEILRTSYMLAKQANMDTRFNYLLDPIRDSKLYILPSVGGYRAIPKQKLNQLMQKVEEGAVLYICADEGLIRHIPEMTGVDIEYREKVREIKTLNIHGNSLPIYSAYFYKPENYTAEVVGNDENDIPVFFKKSHGKGYVYFLTLPVETYLSEKKGAFYKDDEPDYSCIYRELAKGANIKRVCDSDNKYVRLTEHKIDDHSLYVVAINYNNKDEVASISIEDGYAASVVYGNGVEGSKISVRENDAVILKLERSNG